jgi:dTDP-glucose pyrophosphorylase/predicted transcriptional regulator
MSKVANNWRNAVLSPEATIQDAIRKLVEVALQIILVTDKHGRLLGTLCDGDVRRAILKGVELSSSIASIIQSNPLVVPEGLPRNLVLDLMAANKVHQIPIVDKQNQVVGLHIWNEMNVPIARPNIMVIMAGGKGMRLRPHTEYCPKPMLRIGGKPMLEHIINRAKAEGFSRFVISIHYLGQVIEDYFGSGQNFGVSIEYIKEEFPMGTAGALSLWSGLFDLPIVLTNGDVMTDIRYGELLDFHDRHDSVATMAVRPYELQHPFGVVHMRGVDIIGFEEKPIFRSHVNAGIYAISSEALKFLNKGESCDMPTLFERLQADKQRTIAYPMHEPWLDVGRPEDLSEANLNHIE